MAINHRIDVKSYTSLHTLVNDMFPPTSMVEQVLPYPTKLSSCGVYFTPFDYSFHDSIVLQYIITGGL